MGVLSLSQPGCLDRQRVGEALEPRCAGGFKKQNAHLAMDDIKESIAELTHYRSTFLRIEGGGDEEE